MQRHHGFRRLGLLAAGLLTLASLANAQKASAPCRVLLAEARKVLRGEAHARTTLGKDEGNWALGFATLALSPVARLRCDGVDPDRLPASLGGYPPDEVRSLVRAVRAEGGRVCFFPRTSVTSGGFALDENLRPLVLLAVDRFGQRRSRGTLRHERSHFLLWRSFRNAILEAGETDPDDAARAAEALLLSPKGIQADEALAVLEDLRSHRGHNPFGDIEEIVPVANYPAFRALVSALVLRREHRALRPRLGAANLRWLDHNIASLRDQIQDRTRRFRHLLALNYRRRTRRSPDDAQSAYRLALPNGGALDAATYATLPKWVLCHLHAFRLSSPPDDLDDFFGSAVLPEPPWVKEELTRLLLPAEAPPRS